MSQGPFFTPDEIQEFRDLARSRMGVENGGSTVTIRRENGTVWDPDKRAEVPNWDEVLTDEPARVSGSSTGGTSSRTVEVAGIAAEIATRTLSLPIERLGVVRDADLVEITAGELTGLVVRVIESTGKDQATAYRLSVVEVDRPEEWG